ncbi:phytanoyl-CoA dioxygenase family protein [Flavobacteriaceae bacterium 3-367]|uniref:phytanoyl-CoA dioxygenase family protein n=1 Tax=Eudoraea algarum TaxID=3417568 RepID=UPI00326EBDC5
MNTQQLAKRFWEEGYLVLENFFDESLMDTYNRLILEHFGKDPDWEHTDEFISKSAVEVVPWFPYREGKHYFDGVDKDLRFNRLTETILGKGWDNLYCMMMYSKQGSKGQAWHQDCPPEDNKLFNLNRLVYTHDITEHTGGEIVIFPRAHIMGELPAGDPHDDLKGQKVFRPKKGTVVFLHGHCWHRVLPVKAAYRVSSNFRAMPMDTPEDITDICVYRNMRYRFSTSEVIEERVL